MTLFLVIIVSDNPKRKVEIKTIVKSFGRDCHIYDNIMAVECDQTVDNLYEQIAKKLGIQYDEQLIVAPLSSKWHSNIDDHCFEG